MSQSENNQQHQVQKTNETPAHKREIIFLEGEPEQTLPPLPRREVIREKTSTLGKDGLTPKIRVSYSKTLSELTVYMNRLWQTSQATQIRIGDMEKKFSHFLHLPQEVKEYHATMRQELDEQVTEVNRVIQDVYNQLESLLQGKAKPNDEVLNLVLQTLNRQEERLNALEAQRQISSKTRSEDK
ncbi:hypothetical protein [Desulfovibrio cuneatus]|uniref:hypothetical protein n=1 Tax=Desulfovibrio cuneatus TaxID=159728 RepID=UPI000482D5A6|nr:hypothetical protein [Desulfovibrio cuneatus]